VALTQLGLKLRDRPVPGEAAVAHPAEDVPADQPAGQCKGKLSGRAEGLPTSRAARVGAVCQATNQLNWALEGENAMDAVVANMQGLPAVRTGVLLDIHNLAVKQRVFRPPETHRGSPAHLLARCYPIPQKEPV